MFSWLFLDFLTFCFRFYEKCEEIDWERNAKFAAIGTIWVGSRSKMFKFLCEFSDGKVYDLEIRPVCPFLFGKNSELHQEMASENCP